MVGLWLVENDGVPGLDVEVVSLGELVVSNSLVVGRTGIVVFRTVVFIGLVVVDCVFGSDVIICIVVTVVLVAGEMEVILNVVGSLVDGRVTLDVILNAVVVGSKGALVLAEVSAGTDDTVVDKTIGLVLAMAVDTLAMTVPRVVFSSVFSCLGIKVVSVCSVVLSVFIFICEGFKV